MIVIIIRFYITTRLCNCCASGPRWLGLCSLNLRARAGSGWTSSSIKVPFKQESCLILIVSNRHMGKPQQDFFGPPSTPSLSRLLGKKEIISKHSLPALVEALIVIDIPAPIHTEPLKPCFLCLYTSAYNTISEPIYTFDRQVACWHIRLVHCAGRWERLLVSPQDWERRPDNCAARYCYRPSVLHRSGFDYLIKRETARFY